MPFLPNEPRPIPLMHDEKGNITDPREPLYHELRREWIRQQRLTPAILTMEAQCQEATQRLRDSS